jgi:hypothetical protein
MGSCRRQQEKRRNSANFSCPPGKVCRSGHVSAWLGSFCELQKPINFNALSLADGWHTACDGGVGGVRRLTMRTQMEKCHGYL